MKKVIVLIAALLAALFVIGCASKAPPAPTGPAAADLMTESRNSVSSGPLFGLATGSSQSTATDNAIIQLKRGLKVIVGELIQAQVKSNRVPGSAANDLNQTMATVIDRTPPAGAIKVGSGADGTGRGWAVYSIDKAAALQLITSAANSAKNSVAAGNFDPSIGFDDAFANNAKDWK